MKKLTKKKKERAQPPHWLPDWREYSVYPSARTPLKQRAWEFLRRNPSYQQDWKDLAAKFPRWDWSKGRPQDFLIRGGHEMGKKYGVLIPEDPSRIELVPFFRASMLGICQHGLGVAALVGRERTVKHLPVNEIAVILDLALPLKRQLRLIEDWCKGARQARGIQAISMRDRSALYRDYLRGLDAETCGASLPEIASVVFSYLSDEHPDYQGRKRVAESLKSAKRIRDHAYLQLPALK